MTAKLIAVIVGASLLVLLDGCTINLPRDDARRLTDWLAGDCERPQIIIRVPESMIDNTVMLTPETERTAS